MGSLRKIYKFLRSLEESDIKSDMVKDGKKSSTIPEMNPLNITLGEELENAALELKKKKEKKKETTKLLQKLGLGQYEIKVKDADWDVALANKSAISGIVSVKSSEEKKTQVFSKKKKKKKHKRNGSGKSSIHSKKHK